MRRGRGEPGPAQPCSGQGAASAASRGPDARAPPRMCGPARVSRNDLSWKKKMPGPCHSIRPPGTWGQGLHLPRCRLGQRTGSQGPSSPLPKAARSGSLRPSLRGPALSGWQRTASLLPGCRKLPRTSRTLTRSCQVRQVTSHSLRECDPSLREMWGRGLPLFAHQCQPLLPRT